MVNFLTQLGLHTSFAAVIALILVVYFGRKDFGVTVTWTCGSCGKFNETNLIKFVFQWCDHRGDFN